MFVWFDIYQCKNKNTYEYLYLLSPNRALYFVPYSKYSTQFGWQAWLISFQLLKELSKSVIKWRKLQGFKEEKKGNFGNDHKIGFFGVFCGMQFLQLKKWSFMRLYMLAVLIAFNFGKRLSFVYLKKKG